jgi:adenine deaminase
VAFKSFKNVIDEKLERERHHLMKVVRGDERADLVIKNGNVLNVFNGSWQQTDVWISRGFIVYVGKQSTEGELKPFTLLMKAIEEIDATGKKIIPGFVDAHCHVESTMMSPNNFGNVVARFGTTTAITDPHEIVNVAGIEGFEYMLNSSKYSDCRQLILVPSCVPAVPGLENSGASWDAKIISEILDKGYDRVPGIAEVMSYFPLINMGKRMLDIVQAATKRGAFVQGHCFGLRGRTLAAYLLAGGESNHEGITAEDYKEYAAMGMSVDIRITSSLGKTNVEELAKAILNNKWHDEYSICTDDVHLEDALREGHLNRSVRVLIENGITPELAVRIATLNTWRNFGVDKIGAIAPCHLADIQIVQTIGDTPEYVLKEGKRVGVKLDLEKFPFEAKDTVDLSGHKTLDFDIKANGDTFVANVIINPTNKFLNDIAVIPLPIINGKVDISNHPDLAFVKVINRYGGSTVGTGIVKDFGLKAGAIASTVSHDSHNLTVVYRDAKAAKRAAETLDSCGGGFFYVNGKDEAKGVQLPIGGLMSNEIPEVLASKVKNLKEAYAADNDGANFTGIAIIALPVVPKYRMSDLGIVDVARQQIVPLEKNDSST